MPTVKYLFPLFLLLLVLSYFLISCHRTGTMNEEYGAIGEFTPDYRNREEFDLSRKELDEVLRGAGIVKYGLDGSRWYKIIASKEDAEKARKLLKNTRLKRGKLRVY